METHVGNITEKKNMSFAFEKCSPHQSQWLQVANSDQYGEYEYGLLIFDAKENFHDKIYMYRRYWLKSNTCMSILKQLAYNGDSCGKYP